MQLASLIAASRLIVEQDAVAVIANNIANADTPAYQSEHTQFSDWLAPPSAPAAEASIAFVADGGTWRDSTRGAFRETGNPFDLAIGAKDAWFTVRTPQGVKLTRAGSFSLSANGQIVDQNGDPLLDTNGQPIALSPGDTDISIAGDGTVTSLQNGVIGQIGLVRPTNPKLMTATGATLFTANGPTLPVANPQLIQGTVEDSNVAPIREITHMIEGEREFGFLVQFLQAESDRQQNAIAKITTTDA